MKKIFFCALLYVIATLSFYYGLNATEYRFLQVFKHFRADLGPCVSQDFLNSLKSRGWRVSFIRLFLQESPHIFERREVWAVGRPHPFGPVVFNIYFWPYVVHSSRMTDMTIILNKNLDMFWTILAKAPLYCSSRKWMAKKSTLRTSLEQLEHISLRFWFN